MNLGFNDLWPTTVLYEEVENTELISQVSQEILVHENLGIFNSPEVLDEPNILDGNNIIFQKFKTNIVIPTFDRYLQKVFGKSVKDYTTSKFRGWPTNPNNGYTIPFHNHAGATLSGVFYLFCEENPSGNLILTDPRYNANRGYMSDFRHIFADQAFSPKSATSIIFPSFLYHYTTVFKGGLRLAIAVDFFPGVN